MSDWKIKALQTLIEAEKKKKEEIERHEEVFNEDLDSKKIEAISEGSETMKSDPSFSSDGLNREIESEKEEAIDRNTEKTKTDHEEEKNLNVETVVQGGRIEEGVVEEETTMKFSEKRQAFKKNEEEFEKKALRLGSTVEIDGSDQKVTDKDSSNEEEMLMESRWSRWKTILRSSTKWSAMNIIYGVMILGVGYGFWIHGVPNVVEKLEGMQVKEPWLTKVNGLYRCTGGVENKEILWVLEIKNPLNERLSSLYWHEWDGNEVKAWPMQDFKKRWLENQDESARKEVLKDLEEWCSKKKFEIRNRTQLTPEELVQSRAVWEAWSRGKSYTKIQERLEQLRKKSES